MRLSVTDNEFCHNIVKVVCGSTQLSPCGSTASLTMLWRNLWSITGQTHKKLTSICEIANCWTLLLQQKRCKGEGVGLLWRIFATRFCKPMLHNIAYWRNWFSKRKVNEAMYLQYKQTYIQRPQRINTVSEFKKTSFLGNKKTTHKKASALRKYPQGKIRKSRLKLWCELRTEKFWFFLERLWPFDNKEKNHKQFQTLPARNESKFRYLLAMNGGAIHSKDFTRQ